MPAPAAPYFLGELRTTVGRRLVNHEAARVVLTPHVLHGCANVLLEALSARVLRQFQVLMLRVFLHAHARDVIWVICVDPVHELNSLFLHGLGLLWRYHFRVQLICPASLASFRGRNALLGITGVA